MTGSDVPPEQFSFILFLVTLNTAFVVVVNSDGQVRFGPVLSEFSQTLNRT